MFDNRERIVEVVKECPPLFVAVGLSKTYRVVFNPGPFHQQYIAVGSL